METSNLDIRLVVEAPLNLSQINHTPFYCEENVYLLCKKLCTSGVADAGGSDLFVAFISNERKQVPLWHQKASMRADGIVLWDYHVVCVQIKKEGNSPHLVWDLDSNLQFPSPLSTYVLETIKPSFQLFSEFQRFFRLVHAPMFFRSFASDRRHMKDTAGNWMHPPPLYEPIIAQDGTVHNLNEYIEIRAADVVTNLGDDSVDAAFNQKLGVIVSETQLEEFVSLISR